MKDMLKFPILFLVSATATSLIVTGCFKFEPPITSVAGSPGGTCECAFTPQPKCDAKAEDITLSVICPKIQGSSCSQEMKGNVDGPQELKVTCAVPPEEGEVKAAEANCAYRMLGCKIK
jgi:hypothetical protein